MALSKVVAIVTGGGQGLGRATALRIGSLGGKVIIADINEAAAKAVAQEIGSGSAIAAAIDITNEEQV